MFLYIRACRCYKCDKPKVPCYPSSGSTAKIQWLCMNCQPTKELKRQFQKAINCSAFFESNDPRIGKFVLSSNKHRR